MGDMDRPEHIAVLEQWLRSYRPDELFDATGRLGARARRARAEGRAPDEREPARQRRPAARDLRLPDFRDYAVDVAQPGAVIAEVDAAAGQVPARRDAAEPRPPELPPVQPDENNSNRWQDVLEVTESLLHRARSCPRTITSRPTAA